MDIIVASNNKGKLREIKQIFAPHSIKSMAEVGCELDIDETGTTFLENALIKARTLFDVLKRPTLSDDSGLVVQALDGAPGIYSARYSEMDDEFCASCDKQLSIDNRNNALLIKNLTHKTDRRAKFVCVVVLYFAKDKYLYATGEVDGHILHQARGDEGFGYDPLFYCDELQKTFAEASEQEKNSVSHRAKALQRLAEMMQSSSQNF